MKNMFIGASVSIYDNIRILKLNLNNL